MAVWHLNRFSSTHFFERLRQIRLQVRQILQPDVQPHDAVLVVGSASAGAEVVCDGEAGYAGPAVADFEEREIVHEAVDLIFAEATLENDGEDAGRSGEIAFPEFVARARRQRRMEHKFNFRSSCE